MGNGVIRFFKEILFSFGWILFRANAKSRDLDQNLRAVRWTIFLTHITVLAGLVWYALSHLILALVGLGIVCASLTGLMLQYRKIAHSLREELVRSVMES